MTVDHRIEFGLRVSYVIQRLCDSGHYRLARMIETQALRVLEANK